MARHWQCQTLAATDSLLLPSPAGLAFLLCLTFAARPRPDAPQVNLDVECSFVRDVLAGDDVHEMRLRLLSSSTEAYPFKDDD